MGIYDYVIKNGKGEDVAMRDYEGKVLLIVNTATGCGFTPQYEAIEKMYEKYHDKGLEIIDIPCNQFAGQAPETDEEIHQFCTLKYNTQFPQMKKSDVNGENELPLYTYLKSQQGFKGFGKGPMALAMSAMLRKIDKNYKNTLTQDALYKTIRQTDQNVPLQFTAVWTCNDIFGVKGLNFDGFADF